MQPKASISIGPEAPDMIKTLIPLKTKYFLRHSRPSADLRRIRCVIYKQRYVHTP